MRLCHVIGLVRLSSFCELGLSYRGSLAFLISGRPDSKATVCLRSDDRRLLVVLRRGCLQPMISGIFVSLCTLLKLAFGVLMPSSFDGRRQAQFCGTKFYYMKPICKSLKSTATLLGVAAVRGSVN